jgi:hypothetical protein
MGDGLDRSAVNITKENAMQYKPQSRNLELKESGINNIS